MGALLFMGVMGVWLALDFLHERARTLDEMGRLALHKSQLLGSVFGNAFLPTDYVLRDNPNMVTVFITADLDDRISNICIFEENARGKGLGTLLMQAIQRAAEAAGARMIVLETQTCNENAIAFYKRNGFSIIGFDLYSYSNDDPERHEVRIEMGKKLK